MQAFHTCNWGETVDGLNVFEIDPNVSGHRGTTWTVYKYTRDNFAPLAGVTREVGVFDGSGRARE